jgi:hypothetical protein
MELEMRITVTGEAKSILDFVIDEADILVIDQDGDVKVGTYTDGTVQTTMITFGPAEVMLKIVANAKATGRLLFATMEYDYLVNEG